VGSLERAKEGGPIHVDAAVARDFDRLAELAADQSEPFQICERKTCRSSTFSLPRPPVSVSPTGAYERHAA
jgi:hypothetical protein